MVFVCILLEEFNCGYLQVSQIKFLTDIADYRFKVCKMGEIK